MEKKKIIILGATSGIGKALSERYISEGHRVGLAARRTAILEKMSADQTQVFYESCDVQQAESCILNLNRLVERLEGIDLFVLCTGIGSMNVTLDDEIEQSTIRTNVVGWTTVVDWIFRKFELQGRGHLVAISSIASLRGLGPAPSYSATKAYQAHYLEALHQRALASGAPIYVTNIRPGFVDTPLLAHPEKFFWVVPVERAADQMIQAIAKHKSVVTVTRRWKFIVPFLLLIPNSIIAKIIKSALK